MYCLQNVYKQREEETLGNINMKKNVHSLQFYYLEKTVRILGCEFCLLWKIGELQSSLRFRFVN